MRHVLLVLFVHVDIFGAAWTDPCADPSQEPLTETSDHSIFEEVLSTYVQNGQIGHITTTLVDYNSLRANPSRLRAYLRQLCDVSPSQLELWDPAGALALLINAYNAELLAMVVKYGPFASVRDIDRLVSEGNVWKHKFLNMGGLMLSPDDIEHTMIRGNGGYAEKVGVVGRMHAGVVCASLSCPDLQMVPFKGSTVVQQLDDATKSWLANPSKNPGPSGSSVTVSKIFQWYGGDFSKAADSVPQYLQRHAPPSWGQIGDPNLEYASYDWNLNIINGTNAASNGQLAAVPLFSTMTVAMVVIACCQ